MHSLRRHLLLNKLMLGLRYLLLVCYLLATYAIPSTNTQRIKKFDFHTKQRVEAC